MEEAMDLLEDIRDLDFDMQNLDRKIDAIDNGVRNRAYTVAEIEKEELLQKELDEKRQERADLLLKLEKILEDESKLKELKAKLMSKYQNASNDGERSEIGQYVEIMRQVTGRISKRKMAGRIKGIASSKNSKDDRGR